MLKAGLIVNPVAGMGGEVALKGTDGVVDEAIRRGARRVSPEKAERFLRSVREEVHFLVPSGEMGEEYVKALGIPHDVICQCPERTGAGDTRRAAELMLGRVEIIIFVGGDGTARDVVSVVDSKVPVLGVPSGVKMYSGVFAVNPEAAAKILDAFARGEASLRDAEILDIDEDAYRRNELRISLYGYAKTPYVEDMVQSSKSEYYGQDEEEDKEAIAEFFVENMERDTLYLLGAGTTVAKIGEKLGIDKTLLGVDAVYNGKLVGKDLGAREILELLERYPRAKIVVTPIGSQGFIFGRGNQQFTQEILDRVGKENIIVVATPRKMRDIKSLRVDVPEPEKLKGYYRVLVGYGKYRMVRVA